MPQEYSDAALSDELGPKQISNKKFIQVAISAYTILVASKLKYISFLEARWPLEPKTRVFACRVKKHETFRWKTLKTLGLIICTNDLESHSFL